MLEKYYRNKLNYRDYILLFKYGNFYEIIDNDAFIVNKLFNYKLNRISKNSSSFKVGFPLSAIGGFTDKLESENINYVIIENDEAVKSKQFDNNKYNDYTFDEKSIKYNLIKMDDIIKYFYDNLLDDTLTEKLQKVEEILNG